MTLNSFKYEAEKRGNFYDNSESASKAWAASWGLTWWRSVWWYKEYKVGNMTYRSGMYRGRHGGYRVTECEIDGERVSEYKFKKALEGFEAPAITDEDTARLKAYQEAQQKRLAAKWEQEREHKNFMARLRRERKRKQAQDSRQLSLAFA